MISRDRRLAASQLEIQQLAGQRLSEVTPSRRDFAQYVTTGREELAVIARLAPTGGPPGHAWSSAELLAHAQACDDAEVAALAVATGAGGLSVADMRAIAATTTAPILREDLTLHPSQLYSARLNGADAAILPATDLDTDALRELVTVARSLHMAAVIEVLTVTDIEAALQLPHVIVGLGSGCVDGRLDLEHAQQLAQRVPRHATVIALPEVRSAEECAALRGLCDAVVVGNVLLKSGNVATTLRQLTHAGE